MDGRTIHYELRDKLLRGSDREVVEALRKIAHIGIMTASLLTQFLQCFRSDYVSVRIESCSTAAQLMMKDIKIVETLTELLKFDVSWKVRAHAVKAISNISLVTDDVISAVLWAAHFESEEGLRLEAVLALKNLRCDSEEVVKVLQDRWFVESSLVVKRAIEDCLDKFDVRIFSEMETMKQVRREISNMCEKKITCKKVLMLEGQASEDEDKNLRLLDVLSSQDETSLRCKSLRSISTTLPILDEKDESVSSDLQNKSQIEDWNENKSIFLSCDEDLEQSLIY